MSDEIRGPEQVPPPVSEATSEASSAWRDVVSELDALGAAVTRWAKAAVNDPDNKRRLEELSDRLEGLVDTVASSVKGAADSEVGESFKEAAEKTGEAFKVAGERISGEVGPKLAGAFKAVGDRLRGAAERIEERTATEQQAQPTAEQPTQPATGQPPAGPEDTP